MEVEEALERPASEQVDPSRPERREALAADETEDRDIPVQQELPLDVDAE